MQKVIGLVGKKQVGKSTAAAYLEQNYGFVRVNFKDALIEELKQNFPDLLRAIYNAEQELYSYPAESIDGLFTNKSPLIRTLMQNYGTEVCRREDPDYWTNRWVQKVWALGSDTNIVTDDVRFLNEASRLRGQAGIIIRLNRTDMTHTDSHTSETEQDSIVADYEITCVGGDHEKLYRELDDILKQ